MIFTHTINTEDKVRALSILLEEIEHANILNVENKNSKIEDLKSVCYEIDWHINQSIEFAKTNYLREERIILLIEHGKQLIKIQKTYEKELIKLGSKRDLENEYEINSAFDFELIPKNEITLLSNAIEIEKRIREALKETKFNNESKTLLEAISNENYYFYYEVGALFAQGFIKREVIKFGYVFYYKAIQFDKIEHLSEYIKEEVLKTEKSVRQYISATLNEKGKKNFYNSKNQMKNIIEFCKKNNYEITNDFKTRYEIFID